MATVQAHNTPPPTRFANLNPAHSRGRSHPKPGPRSSALPRADFPDSPLYIQVHVTPVVVMHAHVIQFSVDAN